MKARDLIKENESAIVIFTRGHQFHIFDKGRGSTGNWRIGRKREFDKVIIYLRQEDAPLSNEVYVAIPTRTIDSPEEARYIIELANIRHVGNTGKNWLEFAEGGQNPIRYLDAKERGEKNR